MTATSDFYIARADEAARDAEGAMLDNVRDRCLRSEAAWRAMADRVLRTEAARDRQLAAKSAAETSLIASFQDAVDE